MKNTNLENLVQSWMSVQASNVICVHFSAKFSRDTAILSNST